MGSVVQWQISHVLRTARPMEMKHSEWEMRFLEREPVYQCVDCSSDAWQERVPFWVTDANWGGTPSALARRLEKITNQALAFTVTHSQYHTSKARNNQYFW